MAYKPSPSPEPEWLRAIFEEVARLLDGVSLVGLPEHEARRRIEALGLQWYPVYETTTAIDASLQPRRVMATIKNGVVVASDADSACPT